MMHRTNKCINHCWSHFEVTYSQKIFRKIQENNIRCLVKKKVKYGG
jgi:hypothetical protein